MTNKVFVGIDTSNYTTSCAISDFDGKILEKKEQLLELFEKCEENKQQLIQQKNMWVYLAQQIEQQLKTSSSKT